MKVKWGLDASLVVTGPTAEPEKGIERKSPYHQLLYYALVLAEPEKGIESFITLKKDGEYAEVRRTRERD